MVIELVKQQALLILQENANKIYQMIHNQRNHLCLTKCPAFEEVVDTHLYGFSKQVEYAVSLGVIDENEGHRLMSELEYALNEVYTEVYETSKKE